MNAIVAMCRLLYAGGAVQLNRVQLKAFKWTVLGLFAAFVLFLIAWYANLKGYKSMNVMLSLFLALSITFVWLQPKWLAAVVGAGGILGALQRGTGVIDEAERFLRFYVDLLGKVLLWESIVLFILGTISFGEKPLVIFTVVACIVLLVLMKWQWEFEGEFFKRWFYRYVGLVLVWSLLSLVPSAVWEKHTGAWNPITYFGTSETEDMLGRIHDLERGNADRASAKDLKPILERLESGQSLTVQEQAVLHSKEAASKKHATPAKVVHTTSISPSCIPSSGMPEEEWPRMELAPRARSATTSMPQGCEVFVRGDWFRLHYVYPSGDECAFYHDKPKCPGSPGLRYYVANESGNPISVNYAYGHAP